MISLLTLVVTSGLTVAFFWWRRPSLPHSRVDALVLTCLYCLALAFALRFGGRTYPGVHFPESVFLNSLLNGNGLFVGVGYLVVLVALAADTLRILIRPSPRDEAVLKGVKWAAVGLAAAIAIYGFSWAAIMQRLP